MSGLVSAEEFEKLYRVDRVELLTAIVENLFKPGCVVRFVTANILGEYDQPCLQAVVTDDDGVSNPALFTLEAVILPYVWAITDSIPLMTLDEVKAQEAKAKGADNGQ